MFFHFLQKAYVFAFLLSARLFIPPSELLARVCELCIKQQQLDQSPLDMVSTAPHVTLQTEACTRICLLFFPSESRLQSNRSI